MTFKQPLLWAIVVTAAVLVITAFLPVAERLPHLGTVSVQQEEGQQIPVNLQVAWYDLKLNPNRFSKTIEFDSLGRAAVPDLEVPTQLWRIAAKRVLSRFNAWSECEHCFGPSVDYSLKLKDGFHPPQNMRLVQNQEEEDQTLVITVSQIPDESKFDVRAFAPRNPAELLSEARKLIGNGTKGNIPRSALGPELAAADPVRVECLDSALVLWMGGKIGYALVPDSATCPVINKTWATAEHAHIFKLEKM